MFTSKKQPWYRHDFLDTREAAKLKPLMEASFRNEFARYGADRKHIADERATFISNQYANRKRIAAINHLSPLNEDAQIFGGVIGQGYKKLFEDAAQNGIIGLGDVANADASGNIWSSGYKTGTGDLPSYVFGLQNHIALNCIGFDLIPTIAVDTPKVMINYVDTVYGGGTIDDKTSMPDYLNFVAPIFTRTWLKTTASVVRATTEIYIVANDGKTIKTRFMQGITAGAAGYVGEVLATGTSVNNTGTITYTFDNSVSVKDVVDAVNAASGAKAYWASYTVASGGTAITNGTFSIDYTSAVRNSISEATSNNNTIGGMLRGQMEKGPAHKLNVRSFDKQLQIKGIEIEADTTNIQIKDFAAMGVNVISHLYTGVQNALIQALDENILNHLYALGVKHAVDVYETQGDNYSLYIDNPSNPTKAMSAVDVVFNDPTGTDCRSRMGNIANALVSAGYENQMTHVNRMFARIMAITEFVGQQNRIKVPDFLVAGGGLCSALKFHANFTVCPVSNTLSDSPELVYSGTIQGLNVYKNPRIQMTDPRILIGRRGDDKDPGAKFLAYDLAASRQTVDPTTMAEKIRVWSRFVIADVGFLPELNYYTAVFINGYGWY